MGWGKGFESPEKLLLHLQDFRNGLENEIGSIDGGPKIGRFRDSIEDPFFVFLGNESILDEGPDGPLDGFHGLFQDFFRDIMQRNGESLLGKDQGESMAHDSCADDGNFFDGSMRHGGSPFDERGEIFP